MAERWTNFIDGARNVDLKAVLSILNLQTSGNKTALKLRLQEAVEDFPVERLLELIPQNAENGEHSDENDEEDESSVGNSEISIRVNNEDEDLDIELKRLQDQIRKKKEIARLKEELRMLQIEDKQVNSRSTGEYTFRDIEDAVPRFSGDDYLAVEKWIEIFEESAEIMNFDERTKFIYAKRLLTGTCKLFIRTISVKCWENLKSALIDEFKKNVSKAELHNELRNRRKKKEETLQQYVLAMQEIAELGTIDEEDVLQYVIKGIPDTEQNKMILYSANNMRELKSALHKYERMKHNSNTVNVKKNDYTANSQLNQQSSNVSKGIKCFKCGQLGHISRNCPKKGKITTTTTANTTSPKSSNNVMILQQPRNRHNNNNDIINESQGEKQYPGSIENMCFKNNFEYELEYTFYKENIKFKTSLTTLLDSGSPVSLIQQQYIPSCIMTSPADHNISYHGINSSPLVVLGTVYSKIQFDNTFIDLNILVVKDNTMFNSIILGRNFIEKNNMVLVKKNNRITVKNTKLVIDNEQSIIHASQSADMKEMNNDDNNLDNEFLKQILNIDVSTDMPEISLNINENLDFKIKNKVKNIVGQAWSPKNNSFSNVDDFEMHIRLTKNEPFYCAPRRLPYSHKVELEKILDDLSNRGVIRESNSPFASPIVLVKKKTGELRLCIDYRELNKITVRDNYPLPLIEDHLDRLRNKKYFTTIDLKNGFYHVKVAEDSIKYTSFTTPIGQYEFTRMPFGLKNAPSVFERYMKHVFGNLLRTGKVLSFIDDILIATETIDEHIEILKEIIDVIRNNCLQLRLDKCSFLQQEITYLGYKIDINGIKPSDDHLQAVKNYPIPKSLKDVHSFIGLCSYFRKFIKNFALISKPLYDLLKKNANFVFGKHEYETFEILKSKLIDAPVLSIYNPNAETELHCDASSIGFGAVLLQRQGDGKFHPIFYFSKRTTDAESRYHSFELETLSIIYALRRFKIYLIGIEFKIVTDCQSLTLTLNRKTLNPRISRWALELQEFSYRLEHRKADRMAHADALSRGINVLHTDESFEYLLAVAERHDPNIVEIVKKLEEKESSEYEMIDGLIYKKRKGKILFYVPQQMETQVIQTHHEALGHLGVGKCCEFLMNSYWFPQMERKIKNYVNNCLKCIYFSPGSGKQEGELHNIPKGNLPFDTIHIDHFGPLSISRNKNKYILLVIDAFSKFLKLYPVKTTQTQEVVVCLKSYFQCYSRPVRIVSDRGTCFTSNEFSDFLKSNNVQHIKVGSQCPQANGQVERINRVLKVMLSKLCDPETTSDWDKYVVRIEYALNNTVNKSTGFTPATILFGTNQRGELCDKVLEYLQRKELDNPRDLDSIRNQVCQNIRKSQEYNKLYYDKNHKKPKKYKEGDYVLLRNVSAVPGVNRKLFSRFRGPYRVQKVLSSDRYLVQDIDGMQVSRIPYKGVCAQWNMRPYNMLVDENNMGE